MNSVQEIRSHVSNWTSVGVVATMILAFVVGLVAKGCANAGKEDMVFWGAWALSNGFSFLGWGIAMKMYEQTLYIRLALEKSEARQEPAEAPETVSET